MTKKETSKDRTGTCHTAGTFTTATKPLGDAMGLPKRKKGRNSNLLADLLLTDTPGHILAVSHSQGTRWEKYHQEEVKGI